MKKVTIKYKTKETTVDQPLENQIKVRRITITKLPVEDFCLLWVWCVVWL